MKISELKNAPEWLVLANTENADVDITSWGWVIWKSGNFRGGNFLGGNFRGGDFLGGNFLGGNFLGGDFLGGDFLGGDFLGGNFLGGNFLGGDFLGGNFRGGNFLGGNFRGGDFRGGNFLGGNFLGGDFLGGLMMPTCKWRFGVNPNGLIVIGCKEKSIEEWDTWFAGTDVFDTPRNTVAFKKIQASYEAIKAYLKIINPATKEV